MHDGGLLSMVDLTAAIDDGRIDTVIMAFPDLYGRLMGKRLDASFFVESADDGTHACDYLLTVDMDMEPIPGYSFANWERGYGDVHLVPDLATLRHLSWLDRTALVFCDAHLADHSPVSVAPRQILNRQMDRAAEAGFTAKAASELEYYLYRTSYRDIAAGVAPDAAGWYLEDYHVLQATRNEDLNGAFRRHLAASGIPVESTKGEWGEGQHELNIKYAEIRDMADRHTLLKQCCKEVADSMEAAVTFMAKPTAEGAGSSCHIHLSLWDGDGSAFAADDTDTAGTDVFRWFLGGWIAHAAELAVCYAPTVNAYKRYVDGSWAPTRLAWAQDNRTAGFRIVGAGPSLRIECRIPGADANPYLAYAASLAAGLDGIENRIEPPDRFDGDVYAATDLPAVPGSLAEATDRFEASAVARSAFGEDVVEHYTHFFRTEHEQFAAAVTDWERNRYLERI